jgi:hypothetical protein
MHVVRRRSCHLRQDVNLPIFGPGPPIGLRKRAKSRVAFLQMVVRRSGHNAFEADGWGGQSISVIPDLDMVVVTKCDAVNPRNKSSHRALELVVGAGSR